MQANIKAMVVFAILFSGVYSISSRENARPVLSKYLVKETRPEVMGPISSLFEVIAKRSDGYEIILPANLSQELLDITNQVELLEKDISNEVSFQQNELLFNEAYHSFSEVQAELRNLEATYPQSAAYFEYGMSSEGHPLLGLKISDNVNDDELDEKQIMLTAATHGDELITTEVLLKLSEQLLALSQTNPRFKALVDGAQIFILPVVNPDGFTNKYRYEEGRDPNRSYPYPGNESVQPTTSIRQLIKFVAGQKITHSIDFHAYGEMVMYPWAYTYASVPEPDRLIFDDLAKKMSAANSYRYGPISKVIYVAKGSSADYYYWQHNTYAMAVEIGRNKAPHPNEIPKAVNSQAESTWRFLETAVQQKKAQAILLEP